MLVMPRPRIGRIRVNQGLDFIEQRGIGAFPRINRVKMRRDQHGTLRLDFGLPRNCVGTTGRGIKIVREPIFVRPAIRVNGQQDAVGACYLRCLFHRCAPRDTGRGLPGRQRGFDHIDRKR
jgi:hypothetical protein